MFILGILQDIFGDIESDEGLITMLDSIMASSTKVTNDRATFYKIFDNSHRDFDNPKLPSV